MRASMARPICRGSSGGQRRMPEAPARSFRAVLEPDNTRLNWTIVRIPLDAARLWGARGQLRVKGEINGFAFRTSLFSDGRGGPYLLVNRQMQKGGHASMGTTARHRIEPDRAKRESAAPCSLPSGCWPP